MVIGHYFPDIRGHTCILEYDRHTLRPPSDELSCVLPPLCTDLLKPIPLGTAWKDGDGILPPILPSDFNKSRTYRGIPKWGWPSLVRR